MEIRKARIEDSAGIARVQVDSYKNTYSNIFPSEYLDHFSYEEQETDWRELISANPTDSLFVATNNKKIIGYALGKQNPNDFSSYQCELVALHVTREFQQQGVGSKLFSSIAKELADNACNALFLWVLEDNQARFFYEKLGGTAIEKKPWQNNDYFKTNIYEIAYGWPDIQTIFQILSR
jgi:ribosomal protein S18 acetylase RimI-like enzyme